MNRKQQIIDTYNKSVELFAKKFDNLGARASDVKEIFKIIDKDNPKVLEIGCGNGRDTQEILKHTSDYLGIDISKEMIKIARQNNPKANFRVADIESFEFSVNLDIVLAFASLIHTNKENFKIILEKIFKALNPSGIILLSLKYGENYREITKEDDFGMRTYYYYSDKDIIEISNGFSVVKNEIRDIRDQKWLEIILQKPR